MSTVDFNNLVYTASKTLKSPALKFTRSAEEANDLIQETLLKALQNREGFKQGTNIKTWLHVILKNTFLSNYHNVQRVSANVTSASTLDLDATSGRDSKANIDPVHQAISKMDHELKEPFMMHFQGYNFNEISAMLNMPLEIIESRIDAARQYITNELSSFHL